MPNRNPSHTPGHDVDTDTEDFNYPPVVGAASHSQNKRCLPDNDNDDTYQLLNYDNDIQAYGPPPGAAGPSPGEMSALTDSLDSTAGDTAVHHFHCVNDGHQRTTHQKKDEGDEQGRVFGAGDNRNCNNAGENDDVDLEAQLAHLSINCEQLERMQGCNGGGGAPGHAAAPPGHGGAQVNAGVAPYMNCQHILKQEHQDDHRHHHHHHQHKNPNLHRPSSSSSNNNNLHHHHHSNHPHHPHHNNDHNPNNHHHHHPTNHNHHHNNNNPNHHGQDNYHHHHHHNLHRPNNINNHHNNNNNPNYHHPNSNQNIEKHHHHHNHHNYNQPNHHHHHHHHHNNNRPRPDMNSAQQHTPQDGYAPNVYGANSPDPSVASIAPSGYVGSAPAPAPGFTLASPPRPAQAAQPHHQVQPRPTGCGNGYGGIVHIAQNNSTVPPPADNCPSSPDARPVGLRQWRPTNICRRQVLEIFHRFQHAPGSSQPNLALPGPNSSSSSFSDMSSPGCSSSSIINNKLPCGNRPPRCKAVVIGCEYRSKPKRNHLRGCMNDVALVYDLLTQELGFANGDVVILTDDITGLERFPNLRHEDATRYNILYYLEWLVRDAQKGDRLWFSFSGHGTQVEDWDGDEFDGFDESLVASDLQLVIDDEIAAILSQLPPGARLTGLIDACHSGTTFDLPVVEKDGMWMSKKEMVLEVGQQLLLERRNGQLNGQQHPGANFYPLHPHRPDLGGGDEDHKLGECAMKKLKRHTTRDRKYEESIKRMRKAGLIIQFGGSRDGSVANNAPGGHNGLYYGALTLAFGQAVHLAWTVTPRCPDTLRTKVTYYQILSFIRKRFAEWRLSDRQTPQLSCSCTDLVPNLDATFEI